jgi:hypothetical protein
LTAALGFETIYGFHHDVQRLPNGATVVPAFIERTIDINGTPTNYAADMIVVLDKNLQVSWAWDPFDHLDVHRGPFLPNPGEPPPSVPNLPAVEWLHTNAVSWSPEDQNLIVSMRYQDWVVKIDYANGKGDGHVVWRLGQGGDFTVNSTDPNPWFSHQHDPHYIDDSTLILFDNGNGRRASDPTANSRGQVWKLDESTMTATLVVNIDLGNYSPMFGAAERLSNGDYSFTSGAQGKAPNLFGQTIEVRPDGSKAYVLQVNKTEYRSFRIRTLYEGVSDQLAGGGGEASDHGDPPPAGDAEASWAMPMGGAFLGAVVAAGQGDGTTPGSLMAELPPAKQGMDGAALLFILADPNRITPPAFALNSGGTSPGTQSDLLGGRPAEEQTWPDPISPDFFGLANEATTTRAGPSQDAVDQIFSSLGDGTDDALGAF